MAEIQSVSGAFTTQKPGAAAARQTTDLFSSATFLQLLGAQMKNQNPLEPMKDTEFLGQMAQFSQLEQVTRLSSGMEAMQVTNQLAQRAALIGRQVTYDRGDGTTATGTVQRLVIDSDTKTMKLTVGGVDIDPTTITRVEAAP
ncbi:MAG: flagellar hook capping FlgD N-terminal domain-containing protein [Actinomycetota bacterium]